MVIPHTDKMVRIYTQIVSFGDADWPDNTKKMKESDVQQLANEIFAPYHLEWEYVDWFSIYPIGQGISERYTLDERVFMGGDACHTHSVCPLFPPFKMLVDFQIAQSRTRNEYWLARCS